MTTTDKARLERVADSIEAEALKIADEGVTLTTRETTLRFAQAAIDAYEASAWQDIATIPRDGSGFIANVRCGAGHRLCVLRYCPPEDEGGCCHSFRSPDGARYGKDTVTHWMPLPPAPVKN